MTPELARAADALLASLAARFPLARPARLEWRGYRVSAGIAYYRTNVIGLSARVLRTVEAAEDTLVHEYAHLLAFEAHGRAGAGHGPPWRAAMVRLGRTPKVRHDYAVARNRPKQEVGYACARCGVELVRARRLPRGRRYLHVGCGGALRLVFIRRVAPSAPSEP